jgi:hypothetical protein
MARVRPPASAPPEANQVFSPCTPRPSKGGFCTPVVYRLRGPARRALARHAKDSAMDDRPTGTDTGEKTPSAASNTADTAKPALDQSKGGMLEAQRAAGNVLTQAKDAAGEVISKAKTAAGDFIEARIRSIKQLTWWRTSARRRRISPVVRAIRPVWQRRVCINRAIALVCTSQKTYKQTQCRRY